jgi:HAD superfamily hydrolase (TIGR01662 family)
MIDTGSEIVIVMGFNAGGKTSLVKEHFTEYHRINRDEIGGKLDGLVPIAREALKNNPRIVLDNTYANKESRKSIIALGQELETPVRCVWLKTSYEDALFNACWRMMEQVGRILDPEDFKGEFKNDPNLFPIIAIFGYRKRFEKPELSEGFDQIDPVKFERTLPSGFKNKALILDYDDTLRHSIGEKAWPEKTSDIVVPDNREGVLNEWKNKGYLLLGASNQSAVGKGRITKEEATELFEHTNKLLNHDIEYDFDTSSVPPIKSYKRKPFPGMGVQFIHNHKLNPSECIMVGDATSDKTFAARCGFQFQYAKDFFGDS